MNCIKIWYTYLRKNHYRGIYHDNCKKKVTELKEYENNPRNNEAAIDAVADSITEFGFRVPIVIDEYDVIIAGHTRLKAARKLGLNTVPCVVADDLTPEQIKAFRLADNKTGEIAEWNFELLESELAAVSDFFDMSAFGFEFSEKIKTEFTEEELPEINEEVEPRVKTGEVWQLGNHRLICGDTTKKDMLEILMSGQVADMVFTDPPYNVAYEGKTDKKLKIQNDKMQSEDFSVFLQSAFENVSAFMKNGAAIYVCYAHKEEVNFIRAFENAGFYHAQTLIWNKSSFTLGRSDYQWKHEPIIYGWKHGAAHYFLDDRTQTSVWDIEKPNKNDIHPTMKPVGLCSKAIYNSSRENEIVLEPFAGSGSTLIACEQAKRKCYASEIDPKYCDVIIDRWEKLTGKQAILLS